MKQIYFLAFLISVASAQVQTITFYSQDIPGLGYESHGIVGDTGLTDIPDVTVETKFAPDRVCSTGHHIYYTGLSYTGNGQYITGASPVCATASSILSFRTLGFPDDMNSHRLHVFNGLNYLGVHTTYDDTEENLSTPLTSFVLTGSDNKVTTYTLNNFGGIFYCFEVPALDLGWGVNNVELIVGYPFPLRSLRFGCWT